MEAELVAEHGGPELLDAQMLAHGIEPGEGETVFFTQAPHRRDGEIVEMATIPFLKLPPVLAAGHRQATGGEQGPILDRGQHRQVDEDIAAPPGRARYLPEAVERIEKMFDHHHGDGDVERLVGKGQVVIEVMGDDREG